MQKRLTSIFDSSDKLGIWASTLCLVHCFSFPLIVGLFPFFQVADVLEFAFLLVSVFAVILSSKKHRSLNGVLLAMWFALLLLIISILLEEKSVYFSVLSYFSAIVLALSHYFSQRRVKACSL